MPTANQQHIGRRKQIRRMLERTFRDLGNSGTKPTTKDFVFHMTDWEDDLRLLAALYAAPDEYDADAWRRGVGGFLLHAVGHLLAAARLNGSVPDPFGATGGKNGRARREPRRPAGTRRKRKRAELPAQLPG
jgi:hypothetical protein